MQPTTAQIPSGTKGNWWTRNWKWFVPAGCLTIILLFIAFVGSMVMIVFSAIKSTDLYKDPLARAKTDPAVIEALGSPIREGFLVSGNTNVNAASGEGNLSIPISGPKRNDLRRGDEIARPLELFGARRGNRKNASKNRSPPRPGAGKPTLIIQLQPADKKLSVSAILLGILGAWWAL